MACSFASQCWSLLANDVKLPGIPFTLPVLFHWLSDASVEEGTIAMMAYMAWLIWYARNLRLFQNIFLEPETNSQIC